MSTQFLRDAAERIVSTFVMGFVGSVSFAALYVAVTSHDWHGAAIVLHAGAVGGLAAVGSLAKALIAKRKSGTISPASFVKGRAAASKTGTSVGTVTVHVHADTAPARAEINQLAKDLAKISKAARPGRH